MDHGMEYVTLNNRVKMPKLGFGVFQIAKEDCERCVLMRSKSGTDISILRSLTAMKKK